MNRREEWLYDGGDASVGIFGETWVHMTCPVDMEDEGVEASQLAITRVDNRMVHTWSLLTSRDCAVQQVVFATDFSPSDKAVAEQERAEEEAVERERAEAADAWQAQYDDDPSPYAGTYSEE